MLFQKFQPNLRAKSIFCIDWDSLKALGIKGIIFDLDNTLILWGEDNLESRVQDFLLDVIEKGFKIGFLSNDPGNDRTGLTRALPSEHVIFKANKPHYRGYLSMQERLGLPPQNLAMVGDQVFTDIWGANRLGIYSILVEPFGPDIDDISLKIRRFLEQQVLKSLP